MGPIHSCGSCGVKDGSNSDYTQFDLSSLSLLELSQEQMNFWIVEKTLNALHIPIAANAWTDVKICNLRSIYVDGEKAYHLHPELVESDGKVFLCQDCTKTIKNQKIPPLSIAGNVDFCSFQRIGLTMPNLMEQMIIARVRLYRKVVKLQKKGRQQSDSTHSTLRSHCIVFGHDAPIVASNAFAHPEQISEM